MSDADSPTGSLGKKIEPRDQVREDFAAYKARTATMAAAARPPRPATAWVPAPVEKTGAGAVVVEPVETGAGAVWAVVVPLPYGATGAELWKKSVKPSSSCFKNSKRGTEGCVPNGGHVDWLGDSAWAVGDGQGGGLERRLA